MKNLCSIFLVLLVILAACTAQPETEEIMLDNPVEFSIYEPEQQSKQESEKEQTPEPEPESKPSDTIPPLNEDLQAASESSQPAESQSPQQTIQPAQMPQPPNSNTYEGIIYREKAVTAIYSLDKANRSYQLVTDQVDIEEIIPLLEHLEPVSLESKDAVGFLVFTTEGKFAWYLSKSTGTDPVGILSDISQRCNKKYSRHAQWLAYMSPENLVKVEFGGIGGPGYTRKTWPSTETFGIKVDTSDPDDLLTVALFLKGLTVGAEPIIIDDSINPSSPAGLYTMRLTFKSGVVYNILGYNSGLNIGSSDMKESILYDCSETQIQAMRDMMAGLKTAQLIDNNVW